MRLFWFRFENLFLAGENADIELLEWATKTFRKPAIDHWWQTGIKNWLLNVQRRMGGFLFMTCIPSFESPIFPTRTWLINKLN